MADNDLIWRGDLLRHYEEYYCKPCRERKDDYNGVRCRACGIEDSIVTADAMPSIDAVEVVRCMDCKHRIDNENYGKNGYMDLKARCDLDTWDSFALGRNAEDTGSAQTEKGGARMAKSFSESLNALRNATLGTQIRDALVNCLQVLDDSINVNPPTNCPNCGAAVSGKSANCEYCGTMLLWKQKGR